MGTDPAPGGRASRHASSRATPGTSSHRRNQPETAWAPQHPHAQTRTPPAPSAAAGEARRQLPLGYIGRQDQPGAHALCPCTRTAPQRHSLAAPGRARPSRPPWRASVTHAPPPRATSASVLPGYFTQGRGLAPPAHGIPQARHGCYP